MITAIFMVAGLGIGLGMGTVLQKWKMVKEVNKTGKSVFRWNDRNYTVTAP